MKATEQNFAVGLFALQLGSSFKCVVEILEVTIQMKATAGAVLSCGTVYSAVQGGSNI